MATDQTLNNVTQTLINVSGGTNLGTSLPPRQIGEFRVPFVKNLRLGPVAVYLGGTQYTLLWDQPDDTTGVSNYNVYVKGALNNNQAPLGPFASKVAPASFRVVTTEATILTFFVQTQLSNGNMSELDRSPSVTSLSANPTIPANEIGLVPPSSGGTGITSYTDGQLLIGNGTTTGISAGTLTPDVNVTVTNGPGTITIGAQSAYRQVTSTYSVVSSDFLLECVGGSFVVTLTPSLGNAAKAYHIVNSGPGTITVAAQPGENIMASPTKTLLVGEATTLRANGIDNWLI